MKEELTQDKQSEVVDVELDYIEEPVELSEEIDEPEFEYEEDDVEFEDDPAFMAEEMKTFILLREKRKRNNTSELHNPRPKLAA